MEKRHEVFIQAISMDEGNAASGLLVKCSCGTFLIDREGNPAEVSLIEITQIVAAHYAQIARPEDSNGHKLIKGRK